MIPQFYNIDEQDKVEASTERWLCCATFKVLTSPFCQHNSVPVSLVVAEVSMFEFQNKESADRHGKTYNPNKQNR
jgi:hypothetical protein